MHPRSLESSFHHELVSVFDQSRANGPARCLIAGVLHVRTTLGQVLEFLAHLRIIAALAQEAKMREDPL